MYINLNKRNVSILLGLLILLAILFRALPLTRGQLLDTYYAQEITVMKYAISQQTTMPTDYLSGFTKHNIGFAETGLISLGVYAYYLTGGVFGLLGALYLIKVLTIIAACLTLFLLTWKLTRNRIAALLTVLFYSLSQLDTLYNAFNNWLGSGSIPILLLISILFLVYAAQETERRKSILFFVISLIPVLWGYAIWNGSGYLVASYIFIALMLLLYSHIKNEKAIFLSCLVIVSAVWIVLLAASPLVVLNISSAQVSLPQLNGTFYANLEYVILQFLPNAFWINSTYSSFLYGNLLAKIPFIIWATVSFICSTFLAFVFIKKFKTEDKTQKILYISLVCLVIFSLPFVIESFLQFLYLPIIIFAGGAYATLTKESQKKMLYMLIPLLSINAYFTLQSILLDNTPYYVGLSPQIESASYWLIKNTPIGSKIMASPLDGPAIEYWGNRTAYADPFIANNNTEINDFENFLYAPAYNFSFISQTQPDYFLLGDYASENRSYNGTNLQLFSEAAAMNISQFGTNAIYFKTLYTNNTDAIFKAYYNTSAYTGNNPIFNVIPYYNFLYEKAGNFSYLQEERPAYLVIHKTSNAKEFEGSNQQYLIEWAFSSNPTFSYDGITFSLLYSNFSISHNTGIIIYKLVYSTSSPSVS